VGSALSYMDRVNLGFAALTMNKDLGLSASVFGLAAGVFFVTYGLFEVPSNMIMAKTGPRMWLGRIMISWGLVSSATALVVGVKSLIALRLLLGLAEAGFTPGVLVLLTYWFPQNYRGRAVAAFLSAQVFGIVFGSSISGPLLGLHLLGLKGWQWMFILQGLPTAVAGILLLLTLTERPELARWLSPQEKGWLIAELETERRLVHESGQESRALKVVLQPRVIVLTLAYFIIATCSLALTFFMPQIAHDTGLSLNATGVANAVVWGGAAVGSLAWGWWADRTHNRELVAAASCLTFALGFGGMALLKDSIWLLPMMCVSAIGARSAVSAFWPIPASFLHAASIGVVFAFINTVGTLGGLVGPTFFGWTRHATGGYGAGMASASMLGFVCAALFLVSRRLGGRRPARGTANPVATADG
jgi:ACS family tartrate transporter-like MFS transporter